MSEHVLNGLRLSDILQAFALVLVFYSLTALTSQSDGREFNYWLSLSRVFMFCVCVCTEDGLMDILLGCSNSK